MPRFVLHSLIHFLRTEDLLVIGKIHVAELRSQLRPQAPV
jgi:hypothetical protein